MIDVDTLFHFTTVTYPTSSASYLAVKCLQILPAKFEDIYPNATRAIRTDFYMDDLITDSYSLEELKEIGDNSVLILESAGFNLRKWNTNNNKVLFGLAKEDCETNIVGNLNLR